VSGNRAPWLVSLPVALAGCLAAHIVAYALAAPTGAAGHAAHGYLQELPLVAGAALAVVLAAALRHAVRGRAGTRPSPWLFALLPPVAFALQEHLERLGAPVLLVANPAFLLGVALQLPFGLLAWLLSRAILRAAEALAGLLAPRPRLRRLPARHAPVRADAPLRRAFAAGTPHRGPPLAFASRS
jgi:hypothetical protein